MAAWAEAEQVIGDRFQVARLGHVVDAGDGRFCAPAWSVRNVLDVEAEDLAARAAAGIAVGLGAHP